MSILKNNEGKNRFFHLRLFLFKMQRQSY